MHFIYTPPHPLSSSIHQVSSATHEPAEREPLPLLLRRDLAAALHLALLLQRHLLRVGERDEDEDEEEDF